MPAKPINYLLLALCAMAEIGCTPQAEKAIAPMPREKADRVDAWTNGRGNQKQVQGYAIRESIEAMWEKYPTGHFLKLRNASFYGDLENVDIVIALYAENGKKTEWKRSWPAWRKGEVREEILPADQYLKATIIGSASQGNQKVTIDTGWSWPRD